MSFFETWKSIKTEKFHVARRRSWLGESAHVYKLVSGNISRGLASWQERSHILRSWQELSMLEAPGKSPPTAAGRRASAS